MNTIFRKLLCICALVCAVTPSSRATVATTTGRFRDWKDMGCRMSPGAAGAPASGANNPGGNQAFCSTCQGSDGMARWWVEEPYLNLWMSDEPLSYVTSSGQKMDFRFLYKQRYKLPEVDEAGSLYSNKKRVLSTDNNYGLDMRTYGITNASWSHSWMMDMIFWDSSWEGQNQSYQNVVQPYSKQYEALVFRPEGGMQYFYVSSPTTNMALAPNEPVSQITLQPLSGLGYPQAISSPSSDANGIYWGDPGVGFAINYPDGSRDVFGIAFFQESAGGGPNTQDDTAHALLTQRIDPQGRVSWIGYEKMWLTNTSGTPLWAAFRVRYVVDSDGRTNTFKYSTPWGAPHIWQLSEIDDPFGRKAQFTYSGGVLTAITDAANNTSSFSYQGANGWITNLNTPYGNTAFSFYQIPDTNVLDGFTQRGIYVAEPQGAQQLWYFTHESSLIASSAASPTNIAGQTFDDGTTNGVSGAGTLDYRNSIYWGRRQVPALSSSVRAQLPGNLNSAFSSLSAADFRKGRLRHWLLSSADYSTSATVTEALSSEREPSPDAGGTIEGPRTWYNYPNKLSPELDGAVNSWNAQANCVARLLPDGTSQYLRCAYAGTYAPWSALVSANETSYSLPTGGVGEVTNTFQYAPNGIDLSLLTNSLGQFASISYNTNHQATNILTALGQTSLSWDSTNTHNLVSLTLPNGQSLGITMYYGAWVLTNGQYVLNRSTNYAYPQFITMQPENRVMGISNYMYGLPSAVHETGTGLPDLWFTNSWDGLNRLVGTAFADGTTISNVYTALDLTSQKDRLGNWTYYSFDNLEDLTTITDPRGNATHFTWCTCGALQSITDPLTNTTVFNYNNQELLTNITFADYSTLTYTLDSIGRITQAADGQGRFLNFGYNNQGLVNSVANFYGTVLQVVYDGLNRPSTVIDANGVAVTNQFDLVNRLTARTWQDGISESLGYATNGLVAYANRDGKVTRFARDAAGRITGRTNANLEMTAFAYNALDEATDLWDGRTNHTGFNYNQYGWLTNKVDALGHQIVQYTYNPNGQITNRWTPQFANTVYAFDGAGNLTNISYPGTGTPSVSYAYDALNRVKTMVDGAGTDTFTYTAAGQLQSESNPWANAALNYAYSQLLRETLTLSEPSGSWSQTYGYDSAWRLQSLASPSGTFGYSYTVGASASPASLVRSLSLANGASITNHFDALSRMDYTALLNHWGHVLDGYGYTHDPLGLRTNISRYLGLTTNSVALGYDNIGQIASWKATEFSGGARLNEQLGWGYDKADNLLYRTNGALVQTFISDPANQLTNVSRTGALTLSGNTPAPVTSLTVNGSPAVAYADFTFAITNQILTNGLNTYSIVARNGYGTNTTSNLSLNLPASVTLQFDGNGNLTNDGTRSFAYDSENRMVTNWVASGWREEFVYDGLGRRRIERDYGWQSGAWNKTNEVHFIYDGWLLVQERDGNNNVLRTYTRGLDLSTSLTGAGGIGGLLARTDANGSTYYHADGSGNITGLIDSYQIMQARYEYNPFGRLVAMWGGLGPVNEMQFSSMPVNRLSGMPHFLGREYAPDWQGWVQRDPLGEVGGINLYRFVRNDPLAYVDPMGEDFHVVGASGILTSGPFGYLSGDTTLENLAAGGYNALPEAGNILANAGQGLMSLLSGVDKAGEDLFTGFFGDRQLGQGFNNMLAVTPIGWPEDLSKLGRLGKALTRCEKAAGTIDPALVRFSQDSISGTFKGGGSVADLAAGLRNGTINPSDIPPINLVNREGQLFTLDNRRLAAFQQAGVPVPYQMATPEQAAAQGWKFTTQNGGTSIRIRGQ